MSFNKTFATSILLFSMLSLSGSIFAKEAEKTTPDLLQEVDAELQTALDAIPSGNAEEVTSLIRAATATANELSASYKFQFERDKVLAKLKKASSLSKKADLSSAEQELKISKQGFADLKSFCKELSF